MHTLADLLAADVNITTLPDDALEERRVALTTAARDARENDDLTDEVLGLIEAATVAATEIAAEQAERATIAAGLIARADAAIEALDALEVSASDEGGDDDATDGDDATDDAAAPADAPADADVDADATSDDDATDADAETGDVSAAVMPPARRKIKRNVTVPARHRAATATARAEQEDRQPGRPQIVATGEARGVTPGHHFSGPGEMNEALFNKWLSLSKSGDMHPHLMATLDWREEFAPEQKLLNGDREELGEKIQAYVEACRGGDDARRALRIASGGVPGPAEPRYEQITYGQADRPLKDALPNFLMVRGQTVFNSSPTLADIVLDSSTGAIGTVSAATDLAGSYTKDIQEISAPTPTTVTVEANTMRFKQGNWADRFYPERTAAFMRLGLVAFARHNEALRLADIKTNCTKYTDTPAELGAYRDLKRQFMGQLANLRDLIRDYDTPIQVLLPRYVPAMLVTDLTAQVPGDDAGRWTAAAMQTHIESWDPQVRICWLKDSIRGRLTTSPAILGGTAQSRSAGFDTDVEWSMFPVGAFAFGDGGQLDLGVLRDTVSSAANQFQTFFESWEALLPVIDSKLCFWITSSLCATGDSQAGTDSVVCQPQGS